MSNSPRVSVVISFLNSEKFLSLNSTYIAEHVLEIGDDKYTKKFGKDKVMKSVPTAMCWRLSAFSKGCPLTNSPNESSTITTAGTRCS